jgi:tetratricopeptide (TPR) repeat protein
MKCERCDSPVSTTARFCENCGSSLRSDALVHKLHQAYCKELGGQLDDAAAEYEDLLVQATREADSVVVRKHLGNLHFRLGHLRRAREHLVRACEIDRGNAALWHDLGVVHYHMADFDAAIDAFQRALEIDPGHQLVHFWLGNAFYHRGEWDRAAETFFQLIQRYPNFTIARFHLGVIYARQGEKERAQEEFRRVLLTSPVDAAARFYVSR